MCQAGQHVETRRSTGEQRAAFLKRIVNRTDWTELFRSISYIVPPTAVFDEVRIETGDAPKVVIHGSVTAASAEANTDFNRFLSALRSLSSFKSVMMLKPATVTAVEPSGCANVAGGRP